jgi:molecular chaperone DnaK
MRVGIDLGTTCSLIAGVTHLGAVVFPDRHQKEQLSTPSVVHIGPEGALLGQPVEEQVEYASQHEDRVCRFVKLSMGRQEPVYVDDLGREWHAEAISALILKKLARDATAAETDTPIEGAVISVPAHFDDPQRQATRHAGELAGLNVVELIEEPVAAAIYYAARMTSPEINGARTPSPDSTILVYDLGGGTFDATVLDVKSDGLYVRATDGAADLGGRNFDKAIMTMIAEQFRLQHGDDLLQEPAEPVTTGQLRREAEKFKISLSKPQMREVRKPLFLAGRPLEVFLTRGQFEQAVRPLIDRSLAVCERVLAAAKVDWSAIDRVLLAGGSTLVPAVETAVRCASNLPADRVKRKDPHKAIAYGAALIAAQQSGSSTVKIPSLRQRVSGFDLGCHVRDRSTGQLTVHTAIPRNTPIPCHQTVTYYTQPDQPEVLLDIVQRKASGEPAISLGRFTFAVDRARKDHPLNITLGYDEHGMVSVVARDPDTGREIERDFNGSTHPTERILAQKALLESVHLCE